MYQVIKMYGDWEPLWFIDGWQDDILEEKKFDEWTEAFAYFEEEWQNMRNHFPSYHSQKNLLPHFGRKKIRDGVRIVVKICSNIILYYC